MTDLLAKNMDKIRKKSKLDLIDLRNLMDSCLKTCHFIWNRKIYVIENAGPIGLSLMVVMAEGYLQFLEKTAISQAMVERIQPITYKRYVDDSHARFSDQNAPDRFLEILNSQDPNIQYTMEIEDSNKS